MKLIVGLGNVGDQYKNTRHNLGFLVVDELTKRWDLEFKNEASASYATKHINGEKVIIATPNLYMNNSGQVIRGMIDYFKMDLEDVIIFHDDKDQDTGKIKIVNVGGHGGQNGIRDCINHFGTNEFLRVKGGIGSNVNIDTADYVLGKWSPEQKDVLDNFVSKLADVAEDFLSMEFVDLANKYNGNE